MPIARPAAEIEPSRAIASSRSALPGPMAISSPQYSWSLSLRRAIARTLAYDSGRLEPKNSAWLIAARTVSSWNGLVTR